MANVAPPTHRIEILVRALRGEKHLRRALLQEIVDRFSRDTDLALPLEAARALLVALESCVAESDYENAIAQLETMLAARSRNAA